MKRAWIKILGIFDIIAGGSLVVTHYYEFILRWGASDAFTGGLPVFVAAILALICGIYTLKRKNWRWALAGFSFAGAGWVYAFIISFIASF